MILFIAGVIVGGTFGFLISAFFLGRRRDDRDE